MVSTKFEARLSDESLGILRQLLGHSLFQLFSTAIVVDGPQVTAWDIQVHTADRWIIFRCEWHETPSGELDYFQLNVSESQAPLNIEVRNKGLLNASSVVVPPGGRITQIGIWERSETGEASAGEEVAYDAAILFARTDGRQICIAADSTTIADRVCLLVTDRDIQALLADCRCRLLLDHAA